ncbi:STAS domain-containing protein [Amycolatopsis sp. NPDC004079]|uniref:STAS domain-containing protein n=1 Tax=Amycolatopsis sp. NPDC004079 TaxID=3154549 RepID=UPI0033A07917
MTDRDPHGVAAALSFSVSVDRRAGVTVVHAAGVLDLTTAAQLRETTASVLLTHPRVLVLDLTEVEFLDSHGLDTLTLLRERARPGTVLRVVACPGTGLKAYAELSEALAPPAVRRQTGEAGLPSDEPQRSGERSKELWWRVISGVENGEPGTTCSDAVCTTVLRLVPKLETIVLTLYTPAGATRVLSASNLWARHAEELQYTTGDGPGITAFAQQRAVIVPDLAATGQWPGFTHAADRIGVASVLALPLPAPLRMGVLTFYRRRRGAPSEPVVADACRLARIAAVMLVSDDRLLDEAAQTTGYDDVHHAAGMLSARLHITAEEAGTRIRAAAFAREIPIGTFARAIVADSRRGQELLED